MDYSFKPLAFTIFVLITLSTLALSFYAARRVRTASHFYTAGGGVKWFVNGIAFAGDYLSAASFLGIAGMIAFSGFDGFMYSIGFLAGWIVALLIIAEPLRKIGKFTFGDALAWRFASKKIRLCAALSALVVSIFYLIPQMVGAGSIIQPLIGLPYEAGVIIVGAVVILIVATAGMVSTTYVQFIKGFLLLIAAGALTVGVLAVAGMGPLEFISTVLNSPAITVPASNGTVTGDVFMTPGMKFKNPLDFASLALGLILGTAALPHILIRYFTVPTPADARKSTVVAIIAIGIFYVLTLFLGLGANYFMTVDPKNSNISAPLLAEFIGGEWFFAIIASIAFATILGTVSGLIIAAAGAIAHDIYTEVMGRRSDEKKALRISKLTAVTVGVIAIILGIISKGQNVAFLVGLAFAIAASANIPALICTLFWKRSTERGIIAGILTGLILSVSLILISPTVMGKAALFPLENPGIISIPLGFLVTILVSLAGKEKERPTGKENPVSM
ncbi:MAG TPA: cation acetate symporter [Methanospirillum sp.]|uniref:solute symporter family protein n=1 Tax=Methanospirillum sp. TaxID=45200 RepID=UPI002C984F39|nr:cation acetate symporter [Methanospirillum sp.]HWQ64807.1 cation acetate symporter [Methanospirillum sp.]